MSTRMDLSATKRAMEVLHALAIELKTSVDSLLSEIEAGRSYFAFCDGGKTTRLVRASELHAALDEAHAAGVDVRTVQILDLSDVPGSLRRAAAAELN